jgi:hypothetical protein
VIKSLIIIYKTLVGLGALIKEEEDSNKLPASNLKNEYLQMAYSGYSWTPSHSLTAIKYQRHGFVEKKPFLPGERYVVVSIVQRCIHCKKKRLPIFPSPVWMSLTKPSLGRESLVSDTPAGDGKIANLFLQCCN